MKIAGLVLLSIFLLAAKNSQSQEKNREQMIKKIFSVFAEKDEDGFVNLFPPAALLKEFVFKRLNKDITASDNVETKAFLATLNDSIMQIELKQDLQKYLQMGETIGVDWLKAKFVSFTADSITLEESGLNTMMLKGKIYFNVDATSYFLDYDETIWFDEKGWYGVSINRVDVKSKEFDVENFDWDGKIVDSTLMAMDSVVAVTIADTVMTNIADPLESIKKKKNKEAKESEKKKPVKIKTKSPIRKDD